MAKNIKKYFNINFLISTVFGFGKIPIMPGTIGSILAFPIFLVFIALVKIVTNTVENPNSPILLIAMALFIIILFCVGCYSSEKYCQKFNKQDPGEVIIDEVVGQSLVIALLIATLPEFSYEAQILSQKYDISFQNIAYLIMLASFILFRIFDILKPWPINYIDRKVKGGFGIMLDDIVAGLIAYLVLIFIFIGLAR